MTEKRIEQKNLISLTKSTFKNQLPSKLWAGVATWSELVLFMIDGFQK